jgi:hypothetical protein
MRDRAHESPCVVSKNPELTIATPRAWLFYLVVSAEEFSYGENKLRKFLTLLILLFLASHAVHAQQGNQSIPGGSPSSSANGAVAWQKIGPVVSGGSVATAVVQEPTVFITPTPQVITNIAPGAPVLGMFHTLGFGSPSIVYKESLDGLNWLPSTTITIAGHAHHGIQIVAGTMYLTAANAPSGTNGIDIYSGADAGHLTLLKANIAVSGSGPAWKSASLANSTIYKDLNGTWYLLYEAYNGTIWNIGVATCTTPSSSMTCTDYASNPVITNGVGTISDPKSIRQISANSYITWLHGTPIAATLPSDGYFATASSIFGPWTISSSAVLYRTNNIEGVNTAVGQLADLSPVTFGGRCFMYDGSFPSGLTGLNGAIELSIANIPCEQFTAATSQIVASPTAVLGGFGVPIRASASLVTLTTGAWTNVASLTLTPGTWLIQSGLYLLAGASGVTYTQSSVCISTANNNCLPVVTATPEISQGMSATPSAGVAVPTGLSWGGTPSTIVSVPVNTVYYGNVFCTFSAGSVTGNGGIVAQRIY